MKQDTKLIRVDLDFKNAFKSAGHSSLWKILQGFGVPDASLLSSIYEHSTMQIQVGSKSSAAIQLDTGTVQGSALSFPLLDFFVTECPPATPQLYWHFPSYTRCPPLGSSSL